MELNKTSAEVSCAYHKDAQPDICESSLGPKDTRDVRQFVIKKERGNSGVSNTGNLRDRKSEESKASQDSSGFLRDDKKDKNSSTSSSHGNTAKDTSFVEALGNFKLEFASLTGGASTLSTTEIAWVEGIINQAVDTMVMSGVDDLQFCEMVLSQDGGVPTPFEGANMTVSREGYEVKVNISNFGNSDSMDNAVWMIENNQGNLAELVKSLQARQIFLSEFKVGSHIVQLPTLLDEKQTPIHMIAAAFKHHEEEKKDDQRQGNKDQRHPHQDNKSLKIEEV